MAHPRSAARMFPRCCATIRHFFYFMIARTFAIAKPRRLAVLHHLCEPDAFAVSGATIGTLSFAYLIADTIMPISSGAICRTNLGFRSTFLAALVLWIAATVLLMGVHTL
jgi:hypothetical protein